jgi:uncharacterized protein YbaP (TraB family)
VKRRGFILAALGIVAPAPLLAAGGRFSRGVLWRISRDGVAPSHVFGTIHVADPRLGELAGPVQQAFAESSSMMVEYFADAYGRERFLEAAMYLDRQTLQDTIGREDFERALELLAPIGLSREFVNKLKPWGVLINLRHPRGAGGASLDALLFELARRRRLPLEMMENVEEQVFTFDEFPIDSQIALLRHSLVHHRELLELSGRTVEAYLARDLAAIWKLQEDYSRRHPEMAPHNAVFLKRVIFDRSVVMAFRMQRGLRRGRAFVALGALHLFGEKGVLALLENDGYRAECVF